jgi:hypothetical protein
VSVNLLEQRLRMSALIRAWIAAGLLPIGRWSVTQQSSEGGEIEGERWLVARVECARCPVNARALMAYFWAAKESPAWEWIPYPPCRCLDALTQPPPPEVEALIPMMLLEDPGL